MAEIQIIEKDWAAKIAAHAGKMEAAQERLLIPHAPEDHDGRLETYAAICRDFLSHLETNFGSAQEFSDFLREDLRSKLCAVGIDETIIENFSDWKIPDTDDVAKAESALSVLYDHNELEDRAAHKKAFHHAVPVFDPSP